jgi:hypothetical protein
MRSRRVFRDVQGLKEPLNFRDKEGYSPAAAPPKPVETDMVSLSPNSQGKDATDGRQDALQGPQLGRLQPELDQQGQLHDLV